MRLLVTTAFLMLTTPGLAQPAFAHDQWSNDTDVPAWVKSSCCGPEDVHHLTAQQVHAMADGWHIDGYKGVLEATEALMALLDVPAEKPATKPRRAP